MAHDLSARLKRRRKDDRREALAIAPIFGEP